MVLYNILFSDESSKRQHKIALYPDMNVDDLLKIVNSAFHTNVVGFRTAGKLYMIPSFLCSEIRMFDNKKLYIVESLEVEDQKKMFLPNEDQFSSNNIEEVQERDEDLNDPVKIYLILTEDEQFVIRESDISRLKDIMILSGYDPIEMYLSFNEINQGRPINHQQYIEILQKLISLKNPKIVNDLLYHYSNLFTVLDYDHDGLVDVKEVCSGLSLLAIGDKPLKLSMGFSCLDEDMDKRITPKELFRYLCSTLSVIMAFSSDARWRQLKDVLNMIARISSSKTQQLLEECDNSNNNYLSFTEFVSFYESNPQILSWLHILDDLDIDFQEEQNDSSTHHQNTHVRFETDQPDEISPSDNKLDIVPRPIISNQSIVDNEKEMDNFIIFVLSAPIMNRSLNITINDLVVLRQIQTKGKYTQLKIEDTLTAFDTVNINGLVNRDDFMLCLETLLPIEDLDEVDSQFVGTLMANIFTLLDYQHIKAVPVNEATLSIALLCKGTVRQKLATCWRMADNECLGYLTLPQLKTFLSYILNVIVGYHKESLSIDPSVLRQLIDEISYTASESYFLMSGENLEEGQLTFGEFRRLHEKFPHVANWLEILEFLDSGLDAEDETIEMDNLEDNEKNSEIVPKTSILPSGFSISLNNQNSVIYVRGEDLFNLKTLSQCLYLDQLKVHDLLSLVSKHSSDGVLSLQQLQKFQLDLEDFNPACPYDVKDYLSFFLYNLHSLLDLQHNTEAAAWLFFMGLSILCSEEKEQILALSFMFCDQNEDGFITLDQLERYYYAFLSVCIASTPYCIHYSPDEIQSFLLLKCHESALTLYSRLGLDNSDLLKFEQLSSDVNESVSPWIDALILLYSSSSMNTIDLNDQDKAQNDNEIVNDQNREEIAMLIEISNGVLEIRHSDLYHIHLLRKECHFYNFSLESLYSYAKPDQTLNCQEFINLVHTITHCPLPDNKNQLLPFLSTLFGVLSKQGLATVTSCLGALCLLSNATIEKKILTCFNLYDQNHDGYMTQRELFSFYTLFLKISIFLSLDERLASQLSHPTQLELIHCSVNEAALNTSSRCFQIMECDQTGRLGLCLTDFLTFHHQYPISWINILDIL